MYTYQPLPPVARSGRTPPYTRILNLFPSSNPEEPFRGTLEIINLEATPPYEALSYTWGTDEPQDHIWLNGDLPLPIKPNLEAALRFLRPPAGRPSRRLWIDALCIDQSNLEERSRQVQYMRLVYKHSARVIAWIGLKTEGVEEAFEVAKRLSEVGRLLNDLSSASSSSGGRVNNGLVLDATANALAGLSDSAMQQLEGLFEREYFHRTWVVQEIVVSSMAVVKCEELEMTFSDLASSMLFVFGQRRRPDIGTSLDVWYLIFARQSGRLTAVPGSLGPLIDLLENMRAFKATDLRDKIYSVLGICDEGLQPILTLTHITRESDRWLGGLTRAITAVQNFVNARNPDLSWGIPAALKPDYTRELPEVYTDLAKFMIRKSPMFLDVLSFVQHRSDPDPTDDFPSWVPKWFEPKSVNAFRGDNFMAGICVPPLSDLYQSRVQRAFSVPRALTLDGFHVGTVFSVSDVITFANDEHSKIEAVKRVWAELLPNLTLTPRPIQRYLTGEPLDIAFCKALSVHPLGALYGSRAADSALGFLRDIEGGLDSQTAVRVSEAAVSAFLGGLAGDRAATEEAERDREGHLGIGPTAMRKGDEVVVLFRGKMPYVLRRGGERHHMFIGDCYVRDDEIMLGRVTERDEARRDTAVVVLCAYRIGAEVERDEALYTRLRRGLGQR
ncbi:Heterokaryon incompatibility protein 6, OR allele [Madurella mycetomatis]|uniref:Heterokaryon incompatibility protein 6, OR allele n=1 Tax=Madurella mycetomatis TaxID=100816 RepID=A0A175WHN7_9PEZI|nr:Heterokaryon incompatibility protein 6, OR allele [Madurella mycetomatis]